MAARRTLEIAQNDNLVLDLRFKDENGVAADLSSVTEAELRIGTAFGTAALLTFTLADGLSIPDATLGVVKVATPTITLAPGEYVWDFSTTSGGLVSTWARGAFVVLEEVAP